MTSDMCKVSLLRTAWPALLVLGLVQCSAPSLPLSSILTSVASHLQVMMLVMLMMILMMMIPPLDLPR